jgi:hypothetical protein
VRTYSKALTEYKNQTIDFKPFAAKAGETDVRVRTEIKQSGAGKNIELDYFSRSRGLAGRSMTSRSAASVWSPTTATPLLRKFATTASTA